jgi:hypothetical protein
VYLLTSKSSPVLIEAPLNENVGGNEGVAPRILKLDDAVEPQVSNSQQAGYNPQLFWAPTTVDCLYVLKMEVHFWFLST